MTTSDVEHALKTLNIEVTNFYHTVLLFCKLTRARLSSL